ncbi:MAG TPA: hypothetical protein DCR43_05510 [Bacteroidales bacterium]|nr:MAG: hypothetical protein CVU06_09495 [Bacteroidetes bacterium HGW-Bacteroidetes-22]HAQ65292.1 hypothetical protein [Bacteroidales bacterium]HBZ65374.1 hypothetical protein [Bacteroidales bacterium]
MINHDRASNALQMLKSGYNCAQSVLGTFEELISEDNRQAINIASGFGGGMGRLQLTCGALTGAYMVIGLHCSTTVTDEATRKAKARELIQQITLQFSEKHHATSCSELLGQNLNTQEGREAVADQGLTAAVCIPCVYDAVELLQQMGIGC